VAIGLAIVAQFSCEHGNQAEQDRDKTAGLLARTFFMAPDIWCEKKQQQCGDRRNKQDDRRGIKPFWGQETIHLGRSDSLIR
jgi:hypothetical protein